jgi:hypothetical protein
METRETSQYFRAVARSGSTSFSATGADAGCAPRDSGVS